MTESLGVRQSIGVCYYHLVREGKDVSAVTSFEGTLLCEAHAKAHGHRAQQTAEDQSDRVQEAAGLHGLALPGADRVPTSSTLEWAGPWP